MNTSDTLNLAADLIEQRGWDAGSGWVVADSPADQPLCLEGGIQAAMGLKGLTLDAVTELRACPAYRVVSDYLGAKHIYVWNDARNRTASEVIEVLRACAVIEASRERQTAEVTSC